MRAGGGGGEVGAAAVLGGGAAAEPAVAVLRVLQVRAALQQACSSCSHTAVYLELSLIAGNNVL